MTEGSMDDEILDTHNLEGGDDLVEKLVAVIHAATDGGN